MKCISNQCHQRSLETMSPEHDIYKSHSQQIVIFNIFSGERYVRKQSEILMFVCTMVMYKYMKSFRNGVHNLSDSMHGVHNLSDSMHEHKKYIKNFLTVLSIQPMKDVIFELNLEHRYAIHNCTTIMSYTIFSCNQIYFPLVKQFKMVYVVADLFPLVSLENVLFTKNVII